MQQRRKGAHDSEIRTRQRRSWSRLNDERGSAPKSVVSYHRINILTLNATDADERFRGNLE